MKKPNLIHQVVLGVLISHSSAEAVILTDASQLSAGNTLVTFNSITSGVQSNPLTIGDVTFSSTAQLALYDVNGGGYSPPANLVSGNALLSNSSGTLFDLTYVNIRMDFASPIAELGFSWWDSTINGNKLDVYSASSVLLESTFFPDGFTGGQDATFRGIQRSTNDIAYAIVGWSAPNDVGGIDNVSFGQVQVPEPSLAALFAMGSSLLLLRRHRKNSIAS